MIIEKGTTSYGAHLPDLPGCIAVGETEEEARRLIREAIAFHIEGLREAGVPVPPPSSTLPPQGIGEWGGGKPRGLLDPPRVPGRRAEEVVLKDRR